MKGMIKLGTLSDKLNHTAECKESIRQAVNQNLGDGTELISSLTQFDQYSNIINSIQSSDIISGNLNFINGNFSTSYNGAITVEADKNFNFSSYENKIFFVKNISSSYLNNRVGYVVIYYKFSNLNSGIILGGSGYFDKMNSSNLTFVSNQIITTANNLYFLNGSPQSNPIMTNNYAYICWN